LVRGKLRIGALCALALLPLGFVLFERVSGVHWPLVATGLNLVCYAVALSVFLLQPVGRIYRLSLIAMVGVELVVWGTFAAVASHDDR
jgi:hypothetical protein